VDTHALRNVVRPTHHATPNSPRTLDLLVEWIRRFSYKDFTENGDKTLFKVFFKFIYCLFILLIVLYYSFIFGWTGPKD
jgi:hypothetical protein